MAVLPAEIPTGLVTGQFYFVNEDNIDADTDPDLTVVSGRVTFTCEAGVPLRMPTKKAVVIPLKFDAEFDSQGRLVPSGQTGVGIEIPATNSALFNPTGFTWKVEFDLVDVTTGHTVVIPSFSMSVPQNVTTDLVDAMPVSTAPGVITVQGPQGIQGIQGTTGATGAGVPAGGAALQYLRKNSANTTTEWATLNAATSSAAGTMSAADKAMLDAATFGTTGGTLAMRDAGGTIHVGVATSNASATRRDYVDGKTWDGSAITSGIIPDARIANATAVLDGLMPKADKAKLDAATASATPSTVVSRNSGGDSFFRRVTATDQPSGVDQLTRKDYVDAQIKAYVISPPVATDLPATYPQGVSVATCTDASWPVQYGTAHTYRHGAARTSQIYAAKGVGGVYHRTEGDGGAWNAFEKLSTSPATSADAGLMSAFDKAKLDAATASPTDGTLVARYNGGETNFKGVYLSAAPTSASHATRKDYVDGRTAPATGAAAGTMSAADKAKLDAATGLPTPDTIPLRNGSGRIAVGAPVSADDAANKDYVDNKVWDGSDITSGTIPDARIANATAALDGLMPKADKAKLDAAIDSATPSTLVRRDATGMISVGTPTQNYHPARKDYVDGKVWDAADVTSGVFAAARLPVSTASVPGTMSAADKALLDTANYNATGTGASLVRRHSSGTFQALTPTQPTDVTNKAYVDGKKGTAVSNATVSADATSAATQLNALLASLRAAGLIA